MRAQTSSITLLALCFLALAIRNAQALYEDQVGKFDWRRQFVGKPLFAYHHPGSPNLIVATEQNVIAALAASDGAILWRRLLPKECKFEAMFIIESLEDAADFKIATTCQNRTDLRYHWDASNGLLVADSKLQDLLFDHQARSEPTVAVNGVAILGDYVMKVSQELQVFLSDDAGKLLWSREESLASVESVEILHLPTGDRDPEVEKLMQIQRDRFGLRKLILLVTKNGNIFGLDTFTADIIWKLFDSKLSTEDSSRPPTIIVTEESDFASDSRAVIVHPSGYVVEINPIFGQILAQKKFSSIKQISTTEQHSENKTRGIILLDSANQVHVYPSNYYEIVRQNSNKYYMLVVEPTRSGKKLVGYKFATKLDKIVSIPTWKFRIRSGEEIVDIGLKDIDEVVHSPARVLGDREVLYKYINPNLVAIMTQGKYGDTCSPEYYVNVYLIDGITGTLVHSINYPRATATAQLVHSENWLVFSYYNIKSRRTEVSSLEMFEGSNDQSPEFSSFTRGASIKPKLIEHKSFIFPGGIDYMVATTTLRAMTNRHLIVALSSGSLLEIPKIFLDPRRPINMLLEHREEGLVPYMPELPIPSESIINYNQTLMGIRRVVSSPAHLESTSLIFEYGLDLFFHE